MAKYNHCDEPVSFYKAYVFCIEALRLWIAALHYTSWLYCSIIQRLIHLEQANKRLLGEEALLRAVPIIRFPWKSLPQQSTAYWRGKSFPHSASHLQQTVSDWDVLLWRGAELWWSLGVSRCRHEEWWNNISACYAEGSIQTSVKVE